MTTITINIPDKDKNALSSFVKERGGEIVNTKTISKVVPAENEEDDDVTHGEFFGENFRRAINILRKH